jgi:elongation factor 1-gamma
LLGKDLQDSALVDQWVHLVESEVSDKTILIMRLLKGSLTPYSKPVRFPNYIIFIPCRTDAVFLLYQLHASFSEAEQRAVATLNKHLATRTFFVGERVTLADITVAGYIQRAVAITMGAQERAKYPHLMRHLETIVNHPKLREVFGETEYVEKPLQYVPPPKEKKEAKPAPTPTPKAEKKPKAKQVDDEEEEEPLVPAEPKVKNPLDDLPKSTFNLEDWKRAYSNKETRGPGGSLEWFYNKCVRMHVYYIASDHLFLP